MKRILVTGANGQLGKSIQEVINNYPDYIFDFKTSKELDITNSNQVRDVFSSNKYNYCINCAAYTNVEQAEKKPDIAYLVNAKAVKNLAKTCAEYNTILLHISTDYVFDGEKKEPYTVDDIPNPINEYGKSKLEGEKYIQKILKEYFIIRTSWLYSKKNGKNFYKTILEKAKKGEDLNITDSQIGCPTDTNNLTNYIISLIIRNNQKFGIKHFTDNQVLTWYDFAKKILIDNNLEDRVSLKKVKNYCTFAKRPINSVLYFKK
ncbi:dTDP-4-dehydrorhamnose reductase [uncultured Maribacter sp.]|uniref:dTDP-4-dehydrorhamnose reductase n=1 Tax=uncultured Maribacter sp. TaxID=431308 RepID=UPI002610AE95|nr:dTDP-4-dehydrorhamnose reductase [uncultured Maribacter sp.]